MFNIIVYICFINILEIFGEIICKVNRVFFYFNFVWLIYL